MKKKVIIIFFFLFQSINLFCQNSGTGFLISKAGHIATCFHVVEGADRIKVRGLNGDFSKVFKAKIIHTDEVSDLAILKIEDEKFTFLTFKPLNDGLST